MTHCCLEVISDRQHAHIHVTHAIDQREYGSLLLLDVVTDSESATSLKEDTVVNDGQIAVVELGAHDRVSCSIVLQINKKFQVLSSDYPQK